MIDLIVWMFFFSFLMLLARFGSFTWVGLWAWRGGEEALGLENFEVWGGGGGAGQGWGRIGFAFHYGGSVAAAFWH